MKLRFPMIVGCVLTLTSCIGHTSYRVAIPSTPKSHGFNNGFSKVDTLQPTLRWKLSSAQLSTVDISYDLVICRATSVSGLGCPQGDVVYNRTGLKEAQHTIEQPLNANTIYFWLIRVQQGTNVSEWAGYNYLIFDLVPLPGGFKGDWQKDQPFRFRTPK